MVRIMFSHFTKDHKLWLTSKSLNIYKRYFERNLIIEGDSLNGIKWTPYINKMAVNPLVAQWRGTSTETARVQSLVVERMVRNLGRMCEYLLEQKKVEYR